MIVQAVQIANVKEWILKKHYAKRMPSVSYAFGLFENGVMSGLVTYGTPASSSLRVGIAGEGYSSIVIELNRLVVNGNAPKNAASFLVGNSMKLLPSPSIIVSYADTSQGHVGYVYQATNFIYTGLSAKRTDWKIKGREHLHGVTIADESRGQENRAEWMREKYGDAFYLKERPRKHRYIYVIAYKRTRRDILGKLRYKIEDYPKGATKRYDASFAPNAQLRMEI